MPKALELLNKRFYRLKVIKKEPSLKGFVLWQCLCDCGNIITVRGVNLVNNNTKSCGCYKNEKLEKSGEATRFKVTHGATGKASKLVWDGMIARCTKPTTKNYHNYGGRGIKVCERWHTYENFALDMGEPPEGLTLERKDNNGNYSPDNCVWATDTEQGRNKRNNRLLTYKGETKCVTAWAEELKVNPKTLYTRIYLGWSDEGVLSTPLK